MSDPFDENYSEQEIRACYHNFVVYFYEKRDLESLKSLFSSQITNVGSGSEEMKLDYEAVTEFFRKDIERYPSGLEYQEKDLKVLPLGLNQTLVISSFDLKSTTTEISLWEKDYRFSMLWEKQGGRWLIRHFHLSKGETRFKEGTVISTDDIREKNVLLEKLVNQKTRQVCKQNIEISDSNKEIKEIKQRFESVFEKTSDGIIIANWKNHTFFTVNQRICDILGYSKNEIDKFWFNDLIPSDQLSKSLEKILQESVGQLPLADSIPLICKNKEIRFFDIRSESISINQTSYIISLYRDTTEQRNISIHKQQADEARKASEAKNLFLANMSHEIRTPVTGILGMSEILGKTELNPKQAEYLEIINSSSKILLTLINDILDISKIEAGKLQLKKSNFSIRDSINTVKTLVQPGLIEKNNKLAIEVDESIPKIIYSDKMRFEQILMNLVNNALKFTDNGTITIRIKNLPNENGSLKIDVSDTGIGISQEDQSKLFQKFQQIDSHPEKSANGSGLGLYICKKLVNLLEGDIGVLSTPGKGSTFWFTFRPGIVSNNHSPESELEIDTEISLGLNVLLVDDKRVNLQVISIMLQSANCTIDTANNGLEALDRFNPNIHEMVLMDIMMPMMDGVTAMKELRKRYEEVPPIIAITANAMAGDKEKYLAEGFDAYITKPVTMQKLTSELLQLGVIRK
jgi:PAS domain S-box-containing protein